MPFSVAQTLPLTTSGDCTWHYSRFDARAPSISRTFAWPMPMHQTLNSVIGSPGQWVIWVIFHVRVTGSSFWPGVRPEFFRFSKKCPKMQNVHLKCLNDKSHCQMSVVGLKSLDVSPCNELYFYLWLLKILWPENTSSHISRHLEFIKEQGHRVNWVSGSLDSRVSGSLGHKMWPSSMSAMHAYTYRLPSSRVMDHARRGSGVGIAHEQQICVYIATQVRWQRGIARIRPPLLQQSIDISCSPGPQQQTYSSGVRRPSGTDRQTDGRTDTVPFYRSCSAYYAHSGNNNDGSK